MSKTVTLTFTEEQHAALKAHLYPGDSKEAVAIALCGHRQGEQITRLLVQDIYYIPYDQCSERTRVNVTWPTDIIVPFLEKAAIRGLSVVKIHSHPNGLPHFSATDTEGDLQLLPMIRDWVEADIPHASVVMLPNGQMFGRTMGKVSVFTPLESISVIGDDLSFWYPKGCVGNVADFAASHAQAFGAGTTQRLQKLSIGVVGCSGTGSPLVEQLARLGVGRLVLVDDDTVEERNLNRIFNSTADDVVNQRFKVDVLANAIKRIGLGTEVATCPTTLWSPEAIKAIAECDVVFGCMDSVDGRYLLNTLASYYMIPYFDIGIRLVADIKDPKSGGIEEVCGSIHYIKPGGSSLMSRGLISMEQVAAAGLKRNDPNAYEQQIDEGYISGVAEHRPAVISVNTFAAAYAVNEFLARLHPYRDEPNDYFAQVEFSLSSVEFIPESESSFPPCNILREKVGKGDVSPLLELLELSERKIAI